MNYAISLSEPVVRVPRSNYVAVRLTMHSGMFIQSQTRLRLPKGGGNHQQLLAGNCKAPGPAEGNQSTPSPLPENREHT